MRKYLFITVLNLIIILIQESFSWEFFGNALNPNFIIAICFAFIIIDDHQGALYSAFIGGLWLDLAGVGVVGLSSFTLVFLLALAIWVKRVLFKGTWFQVLMVIASTIIFKLVMNYPDLTYSWKLFFSGLLGALVSLGFYLILSKTRRRYLSFEYRIKA